jgi:hypothetical protein
VAPPPANVIFNNIHNTTIINNSGPAINPGSPNPYPASGLPTAAGVGAGVAAAAVAAKVALPPSVARKATMIEDRQPNPRGTNRGQPAPGAPPGQPGPLPSTRLPTGQALPANRSDRNQGHADGRGQGKARSRAAVGHRGEQLGQARPLGLPRLS